MIVCIAEKPSVARDIAEVLGAHTRKEGYIEGNGYQVTWTFGHLCTLKEPHEYTPNWKSWSLSSLPMIPPRFGIKLIGHDPGIEKQFHVIEWLMQNADEIINCGDAGQEGELIQRWVMQKAGARCPVKRLWISSLTEEAIREGFSKLKDQAEFQSLYEAGLSRAMGDWLLGMNATRLYTLKYGQNKQVLSIGRVQTPTLALIVNRQLEIANFEPKQYWELKTNYRNTTFSALIRKSDEEIAAEEEKNGGKKKIDNPGIDPIANREEGEALVERIKDLPFVVTNVGKKDGKEYAPRLFDLTSLQVECNKKFAYSADETLKLIQSLYEKKVATYPRVDTTFLSDDIYPKCPAILKGLRDYEVLTAPLAGTTLPKSKKVFDNSKVTDHHAIIPTGVYAQNLTDMERRVYDLIARRFIAVFYPDCKISTTTVMGEVDKIEFRVTGKQILEPGWRVVFAKEVKDPTEEKEEEDENVLPAFVKGESVDRVVNLIKNRTDMKVKCEKDYVSHMKTSGYRSYHMIILYTVNTIHGPKELSAEIQIRTMAMNFWATIEHSLQYKYKENIPEYIQQKLLDASEAIIEVDHEMSDVRDEIMDAQNSHRKKETLVKDILNNIQNLYKVANQREVTKIQDEFYKVYVLDDMLQLKHFARQLDIISEGYRAQSL